MAGKNESPRQKMIGMMYLVLTALLALQVSSALIYKFQALNTSLEKTVVTTDISNRNKQAAITERVISRGKRPEELLLSKNALEIHTKTREMLTLIDEVKKQLIEETGGYNEEGGFKGANEETKVEVIMIGASKSSGKAYLLKKKLDEYVAFMNKYSTAKFDPLARNASEDPTLRKNSDQKNKDYAHLNFGQTPMVAALAVLSETEAKIVNMENSIMVGIEKEIGINDFTFDKIKPVVKPQSDYVVAGTKYNAEMFMVATSSSMQPQMELGNSKLTVNEDGIGALSFVASGGNYNANGTVKKSWLGKIKIKKPDGQDTVYNVMHEYTVVKPVIQVQSASVQALYRNCGNKLNVSVPALGAEYNPRFTAEGAFIINGDRPGMITLVPNAVKVKLNVNNNGNFLGQENFGVKLIPMPSLDVKVNNRKVSPIEGIGATEARNISIKVLPEKNFGEALPADARYYVSEGKVYLARGRRQISEMAITGQSIALGSMANEMRPGDRLIIEVSKVKRLNFRNETEDVTIPKYYETIILN
jgi:gliding motility-associated protein GldM